MNSRTKRYQRLLRQVARELDEKPTTEIVKHVATLRLMRESLQIRLLAGERVDPSDVLKLDEALKQYLPQGKPITVHVEIVDSSPHEPLPPPPPPDPPPSAPPPTDTKPSPPAPLPAAASNVVELPRRGGSIHDAVLPDGTPARMARSELWRYGAASAPVPDRGAAHSLPPIPPECFPK
jgi:hypothetical protein